MTKSQKFPSCVARLMQADRLSVLFTSGFQLWTSCVHQEHDILLRHYGRVKRKFKIVRTWYTSIALASWDISVAEFCQRLKYLCPGQHPAKEQWTRRSHFMEVRYQSQWPTTIKLCEIRLNYSSRLYMRQDNSNVVF